MKAAKRKSAKSASRPFAVRWLDSKAGRVKLREIVRESGLAALPADVVIAARVKLDLAEGTLTRRRKKLPPGKGLS